MAKCVEFVFIVVFYLCVLTITSTSACDSFKQKESVSLECKLPGTLQNTNCFSGNLPHGTQVKYKCAPNYIPTNLEVRNGQLNCNNRNRWTGLDRFESFACSIDCGRPYDGNLLAPLIVGGVPTERTEWPWHASIFARLDAKSPFGYICGGTLVKPYSKGFLIVSAGHCFSDGQRVRDVRNVKVLLGANYSSWEENDNIPNVQQHEVRKIVLHESYSGNTGDFIQADIAVLAMKDPIKLSSNVLPACFSNGDFAEIGAVGSVVGFGAYAYNDPTVSKTLRKAVLPVVNKDKCYKWRERKLLPSEICAGHDRAQAACNGDSGGGYVFPQTFNGVERFYLEGIVSHGRQNIDNKKQECDFYSVFTRVTSYDPWIREKAEEMFSQEVEEDNLAIPTPDEPSPKFGTTTKRPLPTTASNRITQRPGVPESPQHQGQPDTPDDPFVRPLPPLVPIQPTPRPQVPTAETATVPQTNPDNSNDFRSVGLNRHNYYRRRHSSPDVRLNDKLNKHAQAYAERLIREGGLTNEYEEGIGKNIYRHRGTHARPGGQAVRAAIDHWYTSLEKYNWNNPSYTTFSQVVWKSTTDIGVGYASNRGDGVVVVSYSPPGNLDGDNGRHYRENVFPARDGTGIK